MQTKTMKPSRSTILSLAALLTLAPVGAGVHHLIAPEESRTAATIADLKSLYSDGALWSNRDLDFQGVSASLQVTEKVRTRFSGNLIVNEGDGPQTIPVTGGVSNAGRVSFSGGLNQPDFRLRVIFTGQLNANGEVILGSYNASGRDDGGPINDRGTFIIAID